VSKSSGSWQLWVSTPQGQGGRDKCVRYACEWLLRTASTGIEVVEREDGEEEIAGFGRVQHK
jgi:hypothetical protein